MRTANRIQSIAVAWVVATAFSPLVSGTEGATDACSFRPIRESTSPDGKHALAWGFAKQNVNWKKYDHGEGSCDYMEAEAPGLGDGMPRNYLVDLRGNKALREVGGGHFGDKARYNHITCEARWSPDSALLVQLNSGKWSYRVFCAYRIGKDGDCSDPLDLGSLATNAALAWMKKTGHPAYAARAREIGAVNIEIQKVTDSGDIEMRLIGEHPAKDGGDSDDAFEVGVIIKAAMNQKGKLQGSVEKVWNAATPADNP